MSFALVLWQTLVASESGRFVVLGGYGAGRDSSGSDDGFILIGELGGGDGGAGGDLIGGKDERSRILLFLGVTVKVAADPEIERVIGVERVRIGEVEFHRDKERRGVNLIAVDVWCDLHPGVY